MCVPAVYRESKGLSIIEALANGVPVVQPAHARLNLFDEARYRCLRRCDINLSTWDEPSRIANMGAQI